MGYLDNENVDPTEELRRRLAEKAAQDQMQPSMQPPQGDLQGEDQPDMMSMIQGAGPVEAPQFGPGTGQDFPTNFNEQPPEIQPPQTSADRVMAKASVPDVTPPVNPDQALFDDYKRWSGSMPDRENPSFKPSIGRTILGGVAGGLLAFSGRPEEGIKGAGSIIDEKYNDAMADWEHKGKALGAVAPVLARERASDIAEYGHTMRGRGQTIRAGTAANADATKRFGITAQGERQETGITAKATEGEANRKNALEIARERNDTARANADKAAATSSSNTNKRIAAGQAPTSQPVPQLERRRAENDTLLELGTQNPEWSNYIDPGDDKTPPSIKGFEEFSGSLWWKKKNDKEDYNKFLAEWRRRTDEKLGRRRQGPSKTVDPVARPDDF